MSLNVKFLLLLLIVLSHHVDSGSIVKFLPSFEGPLPFELETEYIGIGEEEEVQSFYYFIKSENNPKEDPLLIWLRPLALKFEVYNGSVPSLVSSTYSWTKMANLIFLDQPVGAGFSYYRTPVFETICDMGEVKRIHEFLQKSLKRTCKGIYYDVDPRNTKCLKLVEEYHKCTDKINIHHTLIPDCDQTSPDCYYYPNTLMAQWANNVNVREALHIKEGSRKEWLRCNKTMMRYNGDIISSVPYHKNNSINGYRSLIFSGDHDFVLPFQATQAWIKSLNYSITQDWRPWLINDQIAGYTRTYSNKMTYATLKSINLTRHLSCSKGGSVANLCNRGSWP